MSWKKSDDLNNKDDSVNTQKNKVSIDEAKGVVSVSDLDKNDKFILDEIVKVIKNNKDGYAAIASSTRGSKEIISTKIEKKEDNKDKVGKKQNNSNDDISR